MFGVLSLRSLPLQAVPNRSGASFSVPVCRARRVQTPFRTFCSGASFSTPVCSKGGHALLHALADFYSKRCNCRLVSTSRLMGEMHTCGGRQLHYCTGRFTFASRRFFWPVTLHGDTMTKKGVGKSQNRFRFCENGILQMGMFSRDFRATEK